VFVAATTRITSENRRIPSNSSALDYSENKEHAVAPVLIAKYRIERARAHYRQTDWQIEFYPDCMFHAFSGPE